MALPAVQTLIAKRLTDKINHETGVHINIDKLQITLSGAIILKDFIAYDSHNDTIFYGKRLQTYIRNPWKINKNNELKFGKTHIEKLKGKIIYYKGEKKSNLDHFVDQIDGKSKSGNKTKRPFLLEIQKLQITNSAFKFLDFNTKNPKILDFSHLQISLINFVQQGHLVKFKAQKMQMLDYHGVHIDQLAMDFTYNDQEIRLDHLRLKTPLSNLAMDLIFKSPNKGYHNFNEKVKIKGEISHAVIAATDLNKINPIFENHRLFDLKTGISGTLNQLYLKNFKLKTDNLIKVAANLDLKHIFESKNAIISGNFTTLNFSSKHLKNLLPQALSSDLVETLLPLGEIEIQGQLSYGINRLKSDIQATTALGKLGINLNMNKLSNLSKTTYEGHIKTDAFKIKDLIKLDINQITSNFDVKGAGLSLKALNANFKGNISSIYYNDYDYHNILVNGDFKKKLFQGQFDVADNNLEMDFNGLIDFSREQRKVDFFTEICKANLYRLHFSTDPKAHLTGEMQIQAQGTNIEDVVGKLNFTNLIVTNSFDTYKFDDFVISSEFNKANERHINFKSTDIIDGYINGIFKFKAVPVLLKNALGSVFANYKINPIGKNQYINYRIAIHNKIVDLLNPNLKVAKNTFIKGKINSSDNKLKIKILSPKITYNNKTFNKVNLRIDNKNPLYNIFLKIDSVHAGFYKFKNFRLLNTTINDTLYLKSKFDGGELFKDHYDIAFFYTMDEFQNFIFGLQKSILQFKDTPWRIDPKINLNRIAYNADKDSLKIDQVAIMHQNEKLTVNGIKYKDSLDFNIDLDSIELAHITPDLKDFDFEGKINGQIHIAKYNKEVLPSVLLSIKHFKLNRQLLGDMSLKIDALPGQNIFVDLALKNKEMQALKLIGYLDLKKSKAKLNASLLVNSFPVSPLQSLFKTSFSHIRGKMTGSVQIAGPLDDLSYNGKIYLDDFGLKILALNTDYQFDKRTILNLHQQTFELNQAKFYDTKYKTKGQISGVFKHNNFDHWYLDLNIQTDNMLVLDTPTDPLEMFYGTVFTGGKARIHGYVNRLKIDAEMQTKPKTNFVITLSDAETLGDNDFVRIISKADYKKEKKSKKRRRKIYEGLEMNFDLDITPDAQVEILLDQEFGSTLVAKGSGLVLMEVNTNGQFNIFGDFAVEEGTYNFKYGGVIDKKFVVEPGSYISWEGDPYNATLDIKAVYETFADPSVLLADQGLTAKKMPVEAIIYLKDRLIRPSISFDLKLPKANAILRSQVDYVLSDPDKKTLQVLSLLSFGDFINENDYNLSKQAGEGLVKTVTERGLNILNSLMAQDDKFQINLNYTRGDENINKNLITDPQVGVSLVTQINKKVYINGKVAIPVGRYTKSSIVGDVELEVYLDEQGNLVFRVFNKQTELEYIGQQEGYTQGIGISYQVDFDTFSDILKKFGISVKTE